MSHSSDKQRFTIQIARLSGDDACDRVQRYLALIFPKRPPDEIARALDRLPLRFTVTTFPDRVARMIEGLTARGAEATSDPDPHAPAVAEERPLAITLEPLPDTPAPPLPMAGVRTVGEDPLVARPKGQARRPFRGRPGEAGGAPASEALEGPPAFFWKAWTEALFSPQTFFSSLRTPGGTFQALLFTATFGILTAVLSFPAAALRAMEAGVIGKEPLVARYLHAIFVQPLAAVVGALVSAMLLHLGIRFFAGPRSFEITLKVVAYASAGAIFAAIPWAGTAIAGLVGLTLTLVGLSSAQRIRPIQALGAVIFPALLVTGLLVLMAGFFVLGGFLILHRFTS